MRPALVIVDMQEVLIPVVWQGAELADRIAALADRARERGVPVVALQQIGGAMFAPEAPGTRLSHLLRLQPKDIVVRKTAANGDPEAGLTAEQIVRRHNRILSAMIHPGGTVQVLSAARIFTEPR